MYKQASQGSAGVPHPFHLHGHNFFVIKCAGNDTFNFDNLSIRDVVSTGADTTYVLSSIFSFHTNLILPPAITQPTRFVTDNAGPHIDFHLELGLAIVFAEDTATIANSTQTTAWDSLYPTYDALSTDELQAAITTCRIQLNHATFAASIHSLLYST
ncbi:hypothetical protein C8R44DRAFT_894090 [Mycena epipterygia]|nr:hypothetical protein C8R44DRAFT_894090 [Mycena epipterygia]